MKEMCRNFVCNTGRCPQQSANTQRSSSSGAAYPAALPPETSPNEIEIEVPEAPMEQEQSLVCGTAFADLAMPYCSGWNLYRFRRED